MEIYLESFEKRNFKNHANTFSITEEGTVMSLCVIVSWYPHIKKGVQTVCATLIYNIDCSIFEGVILEAKKFRYTKQYHI